MDGTETAGRAGPAALTPLQQLRRLGTGPRGLTEEEAQLRLGRHGDNSLPPWRPASWARLLVRGLRDPFTAVLLCLAPVSAAVSAWGTACVITVLVAVSVTLRAAGERRAVRSTAALRALVATTATVMRRESAHEQAAAREVPVDELVPGDVVRLGPGDLVPADVRLLRARGLTAHQAALSGESVPVPKYPVDSPPASSPATVSPFDEPHLCFQGSTVASGSATAVVVATGARTRFSAAYRDAARLRGPSSFDRSVRSISWALIRFMLLTPALVLGADAVLRGRGLETLPFAVAVAVGLTPEMLPVVVTAALARGASRLARDDGVIVTRLPALHDLGAVDVLCLDKTGTLTLDRPVVRGALDGLGAPDPEVLRWAAVSAWWNLELAELPAPDALDAAVLAEADARGLDLSRYEGVAALPFDPVRGVATAVVRGPGRLGAHLLAVKGSVDSVLQRCALDAGERERLRVLAAALAEDGLRVLAVAVGERPARTRPWTPSDERGLRFTGFLTLHDEPAPTAGAALTALTGRGVEVRILTGDHPGTAARACRELGLDPGEVVTAGLTDEMGDAELTELAGRTTVFARCTPEHKARIVGALRAGGHTTGFLGDGVNDLPALRAADVGISPRDAVDVARESADVVLAGKDLTTIDRAIVSGRLSSANITAYLRITLSSNLGNVIAMLAAGLLVPFLPMLPAQVLAQNLCFDAAQLAFVLDRPPGRALRGPATLRPGELLRFIVGFGVLNSVADLATFGVLTATLHGFGGLSDEAAFHSGWFTENLLTQALVMLLLRTGSGLPSGPVRWSAGALAVVGVVLPLSPLGPALGMVALPVLYHLLVAAVLALYAGALCLARRLRG
nr:magnesium-translocating P-type ATPase [Streptomyces tsukubensis]